MNGHLEGGITLLRGCTNHGYEPLTSVLGWFWKWATTPKECGLDVFGWVVAIHDVFHVRCIWSVPCWVIWDKLVVSMCVRWMISRQIIDTSAEVTRNGSDCNENECFLFDDMSFFWGSEVSLLLGSPELASLKVLPRTCQPKKADFFLQDWFPFKPGRLLKPLFLDV